ncbi:hypothetical protein THASP1DRAFT_23280 [Thamnocephalis sphaerospora]|uniref:Peptidase S8/S53 domain-containing protein n=1 Tax=Thamnocephalis sphaerospora TaxID=78915 RepID=A0A4P9XRT0_9FUNG|nr:hypothetical protein THASP1DRAFT_23280 [Thamnocephalis sphaerospora]|eukprot:RKP08788.1 hypothetical protein THASP1DRAFT_23280 [Thamnocephalis sphaerospora]
MRVGTSVILSCAAALVLASASAIDGARQRYPFNLRSASTNLTRRAESVDTTLSTISKTYFMELTEKPGTSAARQQRASIISYLQEEWDVTDVEEFDYLSSSIYFTVLNGGEWSLADVSNKPGVSKIWPAPPSVAHSPVPYTPGSALFNTTRHSGLTRRAFKTNPNGIKIGIIDSGIDYLHPDLGGCFGTGCLVAYGYDFVGDAYTGTNRAQPDADPMDECNGHGTHVAGIIVGDMDDYANISALGAYRVFGCRGRVALSVLVRAMERTAVDGMEIVNISIGSGRHFASYPDAVMAQKLVEHGVVVIASAGNDGDLGMGSISSPATAPGVIAVASLHSPNIGEFTFSYNNQAGYRYLASSGQVLANGQSVTLIDIRATANAYGCNKAAISYTGKYVLVKRGQCTFNQKAAIAQAAGATGVVAHNEVDDTEKRPPAVDDPAVRIPVLLLDKATGATLRPASGTNPPSLTIVGGDRYDSDDLDFGSWSTFSSVGPVANGDVFKPDISATGTDVISTYPRALGSHAIMSGTSMAAPMITRAASYFYRIAVKSQVQGADRAAAILRSLTSDLRFSASTKKRRPLLENTNYRSYYEPNIYGGAGYIAIGMFTQQLWSFDPPKLSLEATLKSPGKYYGSARFSITGRLPSGSTELWVESGVAYAGWKNGRPVKAMLSDLPATYSLSPRIFKVSSDYFDGNINTVRPFSSTFSYSVDVSAYPDCFWIFSGTLVGDYGSKEAHLPFQIRVGDPAHIMPLDTASTSLALVKGEDIIGGATNFSVLTDGTYVGVRFRLQYPSERVIVTVEKADTQQSLGMAADGLGDDADRTVGGPDEDYFIPWTGMIQAMPTFGEPAANATAVPDGSYRLRLHVALPFSPVSAQASYKTWLSPIIKVSGIAASVGGVDKPEAGGAVRSVLPRVASYGEPLSSTGNLPPVRLALI